MLKKILVVGGSGRVGLPLSLFLHSKGLEVCVLDPDSEKNKKIRQGIMPFLENGVERWLIDASTSTRFAIYERLEQLHDMIFDICIIVIGTPLVEQGVPDNHSLATMVESLHPVISVGGTLILRSTVVPGTTSLVESQLIDNGRSDIHVIFAPERIAEGFAHKELTVLPQLIGANSKHALNTAEQFFASIGVTTIELSSTEAECAKLFTNAYRFIHFSTASLFYLICEDQGLDYSRIKMAMMTDYPRLETLPSSGYAGGPCLIKDSVILNSLQDFTESVLSSNLEINERLVSLVTQKVQEFCSNPSDLLIGVLGIGFKAGSDDLRESFAMRVIEKLKMLGYKLVYFDNYAITDLVPRMTPEEMNKRCGLLVKGNMDTSYSEFYFRLPTIDVWK